MRKRSIALGIGVFSFLLCSLFILAPTAEAVLCDDGKLGAAWKTDGDPTASMSVIEVRDSSDMELGPEEICDPDAGGTKVTVTAFKKSLDGDTLDGGSFITELEVDTKASQASDADAETTQDGMGLKSVSSLPFPEGFFKPLGNLKKLTANAEPNAEAPGSKVIQIVVEAEDGSEIVGPVDDANGEKVTTLKAIDDDCVGGANIVCIRDKETKEILAETYVEANVSAVQTAANSVKVRDGRPGVDGVDGEHGEPGGSGPKGDSGCALASSGSSSSSFPVAYLLIPAFILVGRLWRRFEK